MLTAPVLLRTFTVLKITTNFSWAIPACWVTLLPSCPHLPSTRNDHQLIMWANQPPLTTTLCLKLVRPTPHTWSTDDLWDSQSQRPLVFRNLRIPVDKTASWSSAQHDQLFCCNSVTAHHIRSWWQVAPKCEDDLFCGKNFGIPCPYIEEQYIGHMFHPLILVVCS